jgi:netrin-G1 ligand
MLLNLQKVYLSKCRIKTLDRYAFRKLTNLVELDLSYNSLPAVPSHIFDTVPELRELKLSGNPIQRILNNAFSRVPTLVRLELSECLLGTLEARAFSGLENTLEWLKLDKNKLVNVKSSTLTAMQNLHGLELAENPWNCTCELRPLREWMLRQNIPCDVPPVCVHPPRLKEKAWDRLDLDEFACIPKIIAPEARTTGVEGRNVTMSCNIGGIPEPSVKWLWRNRVIANLSGVPYSNSRKMYMVHVADYTSNLTILTADMQDAGVYVCTAENKAGKVEASVNLAVLRRPPETGLSGRVLVASIIVAALFVLASCLIGLCVCSVRRRQQSGSNGRWQGQAQSGVTRGGRRRDDSYEKIEMNHKEPSMLNHAGGGAGRGILPKGGNSVLTSGQNAGVAVVGPTMKHRARRGEYRGVPSVDTDLGDDDVDEDDERGYEDEAETPTPTTVVSSTRDGKMSWSGQRSSDDTPSSHSEVRSSALSDCADLHIPRGGIGSYLDGRYVREVNEASHESSQFLLFQIDCQVLRWL